MKPTDLEVNKKLAEYDDSRLELVTSWDAKKPYHRVIDSSGSYKVLYTESLDAQVPIMEKLGKHIVIELCRHGSEGYHSCYFRDLHSEAIDSIDIDCFDKTIQQASAYALYYAILEDEK